ncbi:V-type proton ATPase subunit a2 [Diplonema papillatum]|nr:V-type proton ATPase subunit a2 [Diplonema papillatum]
MRDATSIRGGLADDEVPLGALSGMWRSEDMELRSLSIERSVLEKVVREFGDIACVQFKDLNVTEEGTAAHTRCFVQQVRSCEAIERTLRFFDEQMHHHEVDDTEAEHDPSLGIDEFKGAKDVTDLPNALETLRTKLLGDEANLRDQVDKLQRYQSELEIAKERQKAVEWAEMYCKDAAAPGRGPRRGGSLNAAENDFETVDVVTGAKDGTLGQLIGTINTEKMDTFYRLIYRVTKGHAVVHKEPLKGDAGEKDGAKTIFRILYSSFEMQSRILKLIISNGAMVHLGRPLHSATGATDSKAGDIQNLPGDDHAFRKLRENIENEVVDRSKMIQNTSLMVEEKLHAIARVHTARRHFILREKAMYHALNMMQIDKGTLFASAVAWIPTRHLGKVNRILQSYDLCRLDAEDIKATDEESPPTYFETNEFTGTFQGIVDAYGIPRYQECNPAIFAIVTFPWLFGIMYGDIGHGVIITISSAIMIYFQGVLQKQKLNEIVDMIFGARWLLLLMGLMAVYMGFLYNDCFGMMLQYSDSRFEFPDDWVNGIKYSDPTNPAMCFDGTNVPLVCGKCSMADLQNVDVMVQGVMVPRCTCPYAWNVTDSEFSCPNIPNDPENYLKPAKGPTPFGFDIAWHEADNKLTYYNSYKMKNAVIVGVLQMSLGLFLSLANHIYFKDTKHIIFGFIPECMFLFCTFGYMCVMLILKWVTPWPNTSIAPNSLETMTNFFLSPGKYSLINETACNLPPTDPENDCSGYDYLYSGQTTVQTVLIIIAFSAVPLMLFPIPILKSREKKRLEKDALQMGTTAPVIDMQEVWIKQVIHTIEFVLGCVSNTASYLRLWALSLAHAELSEVFWSFAIMKMLDGADGIGGGFIMWAGFGAWLSVTIGVLIIMEALSAFLHALRLHWVEFQNKFYIGDGRKFAPLDFAEIIAEAEVAR